MDGDDIPTSPTRRKTWIVFVVAGCVALAGLQAWRLAPWSWLVPRPPVTCELRGILDPSDHPEAEHVEIPGLDQPVALAEPASFRVREAELDFSPLGENVIRLQVAQGDRLEDYRESLPADTWLVAFVGGSWVGREAYRWRDGPPGEVWLGGYPAGEASRALGLLHGR